MVGNEAEILLSKAQPLGVARAWKRASPRLSPLGQVTS